MKNNELFAWNHGVIVACDVNQIEKLVEIIESTNLIQGIVGYKIGFSLALKYGLNQVTSIIKKLTDLPIIYDHQKAGTDIPQSGNLFAQVCKEGGVDSVILFPLAGPVTEADFIAGVVNNGMIPMIGGEMTHSAYLSKDGGFLSDEAPLAMYRIGAENHVEYYIVPGTKPLMVASYQNFLSTLGINPKFCFPGIGRQGGDIDNVMKIVKGYSAYAIIGSSIYNASNISDSAKLYCNQMMKYE